MSYKANRNLTSPRRNYGDEVASPRRPNTYQRNREQTTSELGVKKKQPKPVAETFEKELEAIKENAKDLKGTNKAFYDSIVQRLEINAKVLADLREEHTSLRAKLNELVAIKKEKTAPNCKDLDSIIKYNYREVNNLQRKIDNIKHQKDSAIQRQVELQIQLENFQKAFNAEHPELAKMTQIKNKLDKANIKIEESKHLIKIYSKIIQLFDKQKMQWNPMLEKVLDSINRKNRDISELFLVARDSNHSRVTAQNEYYATDKEINKNITEREKLLESKELQYRSIIQYQNTDLITENSSRARRSSAVPSQSSIMRQRANKAAKELKEEKYRTAQEKLDSIQEVFGTIEPEEIAKMIDDREETTKTLKKQIDDLKDDIEKLKEKRDNIEMQIEEKEFTQGAGVGGKRLLSEGQQIQSEKIEKLKKLKRTIEAFEKHRKAVINGSTHLADALALVTLPDEEPPKELNNVFDWYCNKYKQIKEVLDNEDGDIQNIINMQVLAQNRINQSAIDLTKIDSSKRVTKRSIDPLKRPPKEAKNDDTTRVLDRNAVKALALKAAAASPPSARKFLPTLR